MNLFRDINKKQVFSWALFDFANSAYVLIILSFVFPIFYRDSIVGGQLGDFYWGLIVGVSIFLGGIAAPIVGAVADEHKKKKGKFIILVVLSALGTALLYFTGSTTFIWASVLFVATNVVFEIAQTLYDSFLPDISTKKNVSKISGFAWGLGYIGGVSALLLFQPFYGAGFEANETLYKLTFPLTALFFLLCSIPAFIYLKDEGEASKDSVSQLTRKGFKRVFTTIREIRNYKTVALFLVGFYLFNDALVTLFAFIPLYARTTLDLNIKEIATLLLIVQVLAFPFTVFFGWLADKVGNKKVLVGTLAGWFLLTIVIYLADTKTIFYVAVIMGSVIMGSSQSAARSWLTKIIPRDKRSEFFGFNAFASKVAAITGPILFGAISSFTGNQRNGILAMLPFFIVAIIIFSKIHEESAEVS